TERAGPAVEIGHRHPLEITKRREDRLAHPFGGRADPPSLRREQLPAAQPAGDHPHKAGSVTRSGVDLSRSSSGASSDARSRRAASRSSTSRGSEATRKRGRPCCRVPATSPSPRISRSSSARRKPSVVEAKAPSRLAALAPELSLKRKQVPP